MPVGGAEAVVLDQHGNAGAVLGGETRRVGNHQQQSRQHDATQDTHGGNIAPGFGPGQGSRIVAVDRRAQQAGSKP